MGLEPGDRDYRAYVGPPQYYDLVSGLAAGLLFAAGLRESHRLLDLGCGSLRVGRVLIPYLGPGNYFGIEPNRWLVEEGIEQELGRDLVGLKRPSFRYVSDFSADAFGVPFDFALAQSIFSHTYPDMAVVGLKGTANALGPEGLLFATYYPGEATPAGSGWLYPGVVPYRWPRVREMADEAGLVAEPLSWPHPLQKWFVAGIPSAADRVGDLSRRLRSPLAPRPRAESGKRGPDIDDRLDRQGRAAEVDADRPALQERRGGRGGTRSRRQSGALPDFAIIGVQKGGTTTLYRLLAGHPSVRPAARKELHYFSTRYDQGLEWYKRCFPARDPGTITGEASPYYLFHPHFPRRMAETVPRVRQIVMLRNPVDRAYSHYQMVANMERNP